MKMKVKVHGEIIHLYVGRSWHVQSCVQASLTTLIQTHAK